MNPNIFLSMAAYDDIVKNLDKFATNDKLKHAKPEMISGLTPGMNSLYAIPGGYSRVYKVTIENKSKALRCWVKNPGKVQKRYAVIHNYMSNHPLPYFVDFQYVPNAIHYNMDIPVSWMDWIDGATLSEYLDSTIQNKNSLLHLASEFSNMTKALHKLKIAHGDLQPENIMISPNGSLPKISLIDYDSLYVPTIPEDSLDELPGVSSFQHPRRPKIMKERADYFSELVIFLSLMVYAEDPSYWKGSSLQDKKLLFESEDFSQPDKSRQFSKLSQFSNPQIVYLADRLKEFSKLSPDRLVPLEEVLSGLDCPKGHKAPNPQAIFCPICNDIVSFFGPNQICPHYKINIPKRKEIKYCPSCGKRV